VIKLNLMVMVFLLFSSSSFAQKISIKGNTLTYNTLADEISIEDVDELKSTLLRNSKISKLNLTSDGGFIHAARGIASLVIDFELDTHVIGECSSACVIIFLGGNKRTMRRGSKLGFHQSNWAASRMEAYYNEYKKDEGWESVFDFASWVFDDTQKELLIDFEYYLERNVSGKFAIKTLQATSDDMWYPRRKELEDAGVIVE
jgi:hypothetical protein